MPSNSSSKFLCHLSFMFVVLCSFFIGCTPQKAAPLPLVGNQTDGWITMRNQAFYGPSAESKFAGKLNGGSAVTVMRDDGSGWLSLDGYGAPVYEGNWVRSPDVSKYVNPDGKPVYIRKKYFTQKHPGPNGNDRW